MTILLWIFSNYEILPILGIPLLVVSLVAYLMMGKTPVNKTMTCKDCVHFYEREPKPWRDIFDLGYCDHSREGKIEINKYCPVNKWCDNKFEPKEDSWESVSK